MGYSIELRTRKYVKRIWISIICKKIYKQLLETGLDAVKTASRKVVGKAGEFLGNKTVDTVTKSNNGKIVKLD